MKQWQKINLISFLMLLFLTCSIVYLGERMNMSSPYEKPWHLLPSIHEDSLSQKYKDDYVILDKRKISLRYIDSSRARVLILVDSWGVPVQEDLLKEDLSVFEDIPHVYALHQRLANRTKHAEMTEYRNTPASSVYLFGGDSAEYNRKQYINELGFGDALFCHYCGDSIMLHKIDSLLCADSLTNIAWTTQSSRSGNRDSLHIALKRIAQLVKSYPNVLFIIQGTHRPILGMPKTRNAYKSHWVPTVILNHREQLL